MPYEVKRSGSCPPDKPFGVFKEGGSKALGCHASEGAAKSQLRALYAQESLTAPRGEGEGTFRAREVMPASEAVFTEVPDGPLQAEIVIIRPGESQNRRIYSAEAIRRAVDKGFWENSPMYANHPDDMRVPHKRKIGDLIAGLSNVRVGEGGEARGTATFFNKEFGKFAMEAKQHVGVSPVHFFRGQRFKGTDGHYHERVDDFLVNHSVDFVAFPAAGGQIVDFLPAQESEDDVEWADITPEMIAEHRPDLVQAIAAEGAGNEPPAPPEPKPEPPAPPPAPPGEPMVPLSEVEKIVGESITKAFEARQQTEAEREAAAKQVKGLLDKSGLPDLTRNRLQTQILAAAESAENVEALASEAIENARAELKAAGAGPRVTGMGPSAAAGSTPKAITLAEAGEHSPALGALASVLNIQVPGPQSGKEN